MKRLGVLSLFGALVTVITFQNCGRFNASHSGSHVSPTEDLLASDVAGDGYHGGQPRAGLRWESKLPNGSVCSDGSPIRAVIKEIALDSSRPMNFRLFLVRDNCQDIQNPIPVSFAELGVSADTLELTWDVLIYKSRIFQKEYRNVDYAIYCRQEGGTTERILAYIAEIQGSVVLGVFALRNYSDGSHYRIDGGGVAVQQSSTNFSAVGESIPNGSGGFYQSTTQVSLSLNADGTSANVTFKIEVGDGTCVLGQCPAYSGSRQGLKCYKP